MTKALFQLRETHEIFQIMSLYIGFACKTVLRIRYYFLVNYVWLGVGLWVCV